MMDWDVAIIGGGPAGLMAAAQAAQRGRRTLLVDKNRRPGIKILLSGGARCNLTHAADAQGIAAAFGPAGRFLRSALATLGPQQVVDLFAAEGVPTKIEPGGKVFPVSDRAADVLAALERRAKRAGVQFALAEPLRELARSENGFQLTTAQRTFSAAHVVLATGGQSYPACGTTGDGYRWAADLGHTIVPPRTALTPITSHAPWLLALQGITIPDAAVEVVDPEPTPDTTAPKPATGRRKTGQATSLAKSRGSLLFTHFGVSGPVVLDVSRAVSGHASPHRLRLRCDLVPQLRIPELEAALAKKTASSARRRVAGLLDQWLPHRMAETVLVQAGIPVDRTAAEFSKQERRCLVQTLKKLEVPVAGTMGFRKAEVTAGGVALAEVDSRNMQSRIVPQLYFAGELLDLDGPIGGYNFQAAFSTGWLAGMHV